MEESSELTEYEKKMLQIEEEKLEAIQGIRKDLKKSRRMESIHRTIEELGVDKEDVMFLVKYVLKKIDEYRGKESEVSEGIKGVVTELLEEKDGDSIHVEFSQD